MSNEIKKSEMFRFALTVWPLSLCEWIQSVRYGSSVIPFRPIAVPAYPTAVDNCMPMY